MRWFTNGFGERQYRSDSWTATWPISHCRTVGLDIAIGLSCSWDAIISHSSKNGLNGYHAVSIRSFAVHENEWDGSAITDNDSGVFDE